MISYITTAIPYVNARPHLGHALELVQTDVLARHRRRRGHQVTFLTGTDDNAAKNVSAAAAAGVAVGDFVADNGDAFLALADALAISVDDTIRTATDPRHRPAVIKLWTAIRPDLYRRSYHGLYCSGCEQFYRVEELPGGLCPEHRTPPHQVTEQNWFFALSRYQQPIRSAISTGAVEIQPAHRRAEVLSFIDSGLRDFSVSRPTVRTGGWGIAVPDDPDQTVYVWADALINYISAAGYAADPDRYRRLWVDADERVHVIGKGISRFHAVCWLGLLLSAGEPLPTRIAIHEYLQTGGHKIAKSRPAGNDPAPATVEPRALLHRYGRDALRWWLLSDVTPVGDTDFTEDRLRARYTEDLANTIGNLINRTVGLARRVPGIAADRGRTTSCGPDQIADGATELGRAVRLGVELPRRVDAALDAFDHRSACTAIVRTAAAANAAIEATRPWRFADAAAAGDDAARRSLTGVLAPLLRICTVLADELHPFIPDGADRLRQAIGDTAPVGAPAGPAFPRL